MLRFGGTFSSREIRLQTKCASTAALARTLLQKHFGITDGRTCGGIVLYGQAAALLFGAYHAAEADSVLTIEKIVQCEHCTGAFLRGVFLAVGNLSDPGSAYHLDLCMKNEQTAHALQSFLQKLSMPPKYTVRNREPLLYYKGSEAIEDFLVTVGARRAAFAVMDMKIRKDIGGKWKPPVAGNCEIAAGWAACPIAHCLTADGIAASYASGSNFTDACTAA